MAVSKRPLDFTYEVNDIVGVRVGSAAINVLIGGVQVMVAPLVLSVASTEALGAVMAAGGIGMLAGGLVMALWGGPKRRINGALGFMLIAALAIAVAALAQSAMVLALAAGTFFFAIPIMSGSSQAIWQTKVARGVQGRVFALSGMIAWAALPIGYLAAGRIAEGLLEPAMAADGALAPVFGSIVGTGAGRGFALWFLFAGLLIAGVVASAYAHHDIRHVEDDPPAGDSGGLVPVAPSGARP